MRTLTGDAATASMGTSGASAKTAAYDADNDDDAKQQDTDPDGNLCFLGELGLEYLVMRISCSFLADFSFSVEEKKTKIELTDDLNSKLSIFIRSHKKLKSTFRLERFLTE